MPQYDVHLYKLYRVKHAGVEASSMEEAISKATELPDRQAEYIEEVEDEECQEALVDVVGDEDYQQTTRFDLQWADDGRTIARKSNDKVRSLRSQALSLCRELAEFIKDGDFVNGKEYYADGNDEEIDALYSFVSGAREILGLPDVAGEEAER